MHANFQELLSLRDGEPAAADVQRHVSNCPRCGLEFARLQRLQDELRQLPQFEPPKHTWQLIGAQMDQNPNRPSSRGRIYLSAAVAAGILIALTVLRTTHLNPTANDPIGPLVSRSQQLEAILQTLPQRPTVERAATSATIDELQTRIQLLDLQLASVSRDDRESERARRLWSTRVQLLDSLVYVRYAEAARGGNGAAANSLETGVI